MPRGPTKEDGFQKEQKKERAKVKVKGGEKRLGEKKSFSQGKTCRKWGPGQEVKTLRKGWKFGVAKFHGAEGQPEWGNRTRKKKRERTCLLPRK